MEGAGFGKLIWQVFEGRTLQDAGRKETSYYWGIYGLSPHAYILVRSVHVDESRPHNDREIHHNSQAWCEQLVGLLEVLVGRPGAAKDPRKVVATVHHWTLERVIVVASHIFLVDVV
jgi:hypothetical protein